MISMGFPWDIFTQKCHLVKDGKLQKVAGYGKLQNCSLKPRTFNGTNQQLIDQAKLNNRVSSYSSRSFVCMRLRICISVCITSTTLSINQQRTPGSQPWSWLSWTLAVLLCLVGCFHAQKRFCHTHPRAIERVAVLWAWRYWEKCTGFYQSFQDATCTHPAFDSVRWSACRNMKKARHYTSCTGSTINTYQHNKSLGERGLSNIQPNTPESCQGTLEATLSSPSSICWQIGPGSGSGHEWWTRRTWLCSTGKPAPWWWQLRLAGKYQLMHHKPRCSPVTSRPRSCPPSSPRKPREWLWHMQLPQLLRIPGRML